MNRSRSSFLGLLLGTLLFSGCATHKVNPASLPADELFNRANAFYEAGKYSRSLPLLSAFVQAHVGDERLPRARMMLGRVYQKRREWVSAVAEFQHVVEDYPSSPLNLEARYAICESYTALSPRPTLDQEYTRAALDHCRSVADNFPGTPEAEKAAVTVRELEVKLATKLYDTGVFYQRRRAYDAAVVYFNDVVASYPRTPQAPAALQQLMETYRIMGYVEEADEAKARLIREYPDSAEAHAVQA